MVTDALQFEEWETPFWGGDLQIIDLHWGDGSFSCRTKEGKEFKLEENPLFKNVELQAHILDLSDGCLYRINYSQVNGFRLLDEHGLLELWEERDKQKVKLKSTFKVKNHMWSKESPLTFFHGNSDEWSHVVSTDNECLEVVCENTPSIVKIGQVTPVYYPKKKDKINFKLLQYSKR